MDSNTHSTQPPEPPVELPDHLADLAAAVDQLAAQDRQGLADSVRAQRVLAWRQLLDRQEGLWLQELAEVDAAGAAGADRGEVAPSTASWLRNRLRMGAGAAREVVRTARALFRGPLPDHLAADAEPVLLETAVRVDPPRLRQAVGYLLQVADPDQADQQAQHHHERRGLWLSPTLDGMVAVDGLLEPEAGHTVLAALNPWLAPPMPTTPAMVASGPPTPWPSWPAAPLRVAGCPGWVGSAPSCW